MIQPLISIIVLVVIFLPHQAVYAQDSPVAEASALPTMFESEPDKRVSQLRMYLTAHQSPMSDDARHFVAEADRLNLDWKLVAAIAGVESTFGKHIPANSYNGWGWGVFTGRNDGIHFRSWRDGITQVSEGLKYRYIDHGLTSVEQMGTIYAASPAWSQKVRYFLQRIEEYAPTRTSHLAVTI